MYGGVFSYLCLSTSGRGIAGVFPKKQTRKVRTAPGTTPPNGWGLFFPEKQQTVPQKITAFCQAFLRQAQNDTVEAGER